MTEEYVKILKENLEQVSVCQSESLLSSNMKEQNLHHSCWRTMSRRPEWIYWKSVGRTEDHQIWRTLSDSPKKNVLGLHTGRCCCCCWKLQPMTAGYYLAKTPQLTISIRGSKNFAALPAASADNQNKLFFNVLFAYFGKLLLLFYCIKYRKIIIIKNRILILS